MVFRDLRFSETCAFWDYVLIWCLHEGQAATKHEAHSVCRFCYRVNLTLGAKNILGLMSTQVLSPTHFFFVFFNCLNEKTVDVPNLTKSCSSYFMIYI